MQAGFQCFCGYESDKSKFDPKTTCDMACRGDGSTICGGGWALDIYSIGMFKIRKCKI